MKAVTIDTPTLNQIKAECFNAIAEEKLGPHGCYIEPAEQAAQAMEQLAINTYSMGYRAGIVHQDSILADFSQLPGSVQNVFRFAMTAWCKGDLLDACTELQRLAAEALHQARRK